MSTNIIDILGVNTLALRGLGTEFNKFKMSGCQHPTVVGFDGWEIEKDKGTITIKIATGHSRTVK